MTEAEAAALGGYYVEHNGRTHAVLFAGETWVAIAAGDGELSDAIEHGSNSRGDWVKLPVESLTRRFRRTVEATWQGEPVTVVGPLVEGTVLVHYRRSPERAAELGLEGDRQQGWQRRVPHDQVDVVDVSETDYSA